VKRALEHWRRQPEDLTARAYDDVPAAIHGLAARSALAHLLKLEAEHRAFQAGGLWHLAAAD